MTMKYHHNELVRATRDLAGNGKEYTFADLLKIVKIYYPNFPDNQFFPYSHCINHSEPKEKYPCCCERTENAIFECNKSNPRKFLYRVR